LPTSYQCCSIRFAGHKAK